MKFAFQILQKWAEKEGSSALAVWKGFVRTVALLIGAATHFLSRNLSEVQRSVTGQKGFVFFCLFLLGGREREMSKNLGESGIRQSSGAFVLKKKPFTETGPSWL